MSPVYIYVMANPLCHLLEPTIHKPTRDPRKQVPEKQLSLGIGEEVT